MSLAYLRCIHVLERIRNHGRGAGRCEPDTVLRRLLCVLLIAGCSSATRGGLDTTGGEDAPAAVDSLTIAPDSAVLDPRVEILWDGWGVPHIFAKDVSALFFGFGWAQMRSHGDLILRLYGHARGRASEYWGAQHLASDRWVRINGIPERAREWWNWQDPFMRAYVESFVEGLNAYAWAHPDALTDSLKAVLPIAPADVLAHIQRVVHFTFVANPDLVARSSRAWQARAGSNAWAIAPTRSAGGNAMLLMNPHLPWGDQFTLYEAQVVTPGVDAYGAALVGLPVLSIAFNDSLGWTHTVNTHDGADLFELRLVEGGYAWDQGVRALDSTRVSLKVKQPDGSMAEEPLVIVRSLHGPVVTQTDSTALALRVVGLDQPHLIEQTWQMLRARNLAEFETSLARLQLPMFTVMYADRRGHILHVFNGQVPIRSSGDFDDWRGVVPGNSPDRIWTAYHPYRDLPRVLDPPTGWLQNANDPPWTTTIPFPLDPARYPAYMAPRPRMSFRAQRSARMLAEDQRITFEELIAYKHSTRMEAADHVLEDVIHAARTHGGDRAKEAADVLERWDRHADSGSRGALLFHVYMQEVAQREWPRGSPYDVEWSPIAPLATPDGISDPRTVAAALDAAADTVAQRFGALDTPWGQVFRLRRDDTDLPASGGPGGLGIFRVTDFERTGGSRFTAIGGDSFVALVEFTTPLRAQVLLSYGNSSQPGSPHRTDQLLLYSRKQLRPVWRTRGEVEANVVEREVF